MSRRTGVSRFANGNTLLVYFYDIMRLDEKLLLEALRERAHVEPVHLRGQPLPLGGDPIVAGASLAVARGVSHSTVFYAALAAESWGLRSINSSGALAVARDKAWSQALLERAGLPTPKGYVALDGGSLLEAANRIGYPVIAKPLKGSWGRLVHMLRDEQEARIAAEHKEYLPLDLRGSIVQEYVRKPDRDLRVFCVGGSVTAGIYRVLEGGTATNIAQGARAEPVKVTSEIEELVARSCEVLGVEVGGVDLIEDPERGLLVLEVNPTPEFKETQRVTGVDVAGIVAGYLVSQARR